MSVFMGILGFSLLIIVHELGHFLLAKANNVKVEEFSIGMGPKIIGIKGKETEYLIKALPIGGYVKMLGEEEKTDDPRAFANKSPWRRLSIIAAGPIMNILLAIVLFVSIGNSIGFASKTLNNITAGSPAQSAGIKVGDEVISINGSKVYTWDHLSMSIAASKSEQLKIGILRNGESLEYNVIPAFDQKNNRYIIGISPAVINNPSLAQSITYGFNETKFFFKAIIVGFKDLFKGKVSANDVGGPVTIVKMSAKAAEQGMGSLGFFIAFISINLAVFNIIPFPALDGGWIFLLLFEIITGKKINDKKVAIANYIGFTLLMILMVLVLIKDIFFPVKI